MYTQNLQLHQLKNRFPKHIKNHVMKSTKLNTQVLVVPAFVVCNIQMSDTHKAMLTTLSHRNRS